MIYLYVVLVAVALFLLISVAISISNFFVFRSLKKYPPTVSGIPVSVLVPARNEEEAIGPCIKSLLGQDYPSFEVRVLDDGSSDGTWQILQKLAAEDRRLTAGKGKPLPQGWMGKHWACHQLALEATGDLLLFTDADTFHETGTLSRAVSALTVEKADLVSALPRQIMRSFAEKLIMPFSYWAIMSFLPLVIAYRTRNPVFSAATGQFMLFRRSAYDHIGGFESVKNQVVDDVELCKRIRTHGLSWRLLDGHDGYSVRQYKTFRELFEGHTKNMFAGFGNNNVLIFVAIWLCLLATFCLPPAVLIAGLVNPHAVSAQIIWLSVSGTVIGFITWILAYVRFGFPLYLAALFPFVVMIMCAVGIASMVLDLRGRAAWKGRITSNV